MTMLKFPPNDEFMSFCRTEGFPNNYNDCLKATLQNDLGSTNSSINDLMRAYFDRFKDTDYFSVASEAYRIIKSYGTDAHVYLPGIGVINGLTAGNYLESTGVTAATVDNPVGLVVDSGGINAIQATTANKPILRRGAVNLLTYSEQFDTASWNKSNTVVSANATTAPNGTPTADKLIASATTASHFIAQIPITGNADAYAIYLKAAEESVIAIGNSTASASAVFNLATGVIVSKATGCDASITSVGSGWYRCYFKGRVGTDTGWTYVSLRGNLTSYLGDGVSGIYVWGAMENTGILADYISTTTAPASNLVGNYGWSFDGTNDSLALGSVPFQMADDHCVIAGASGTASASYPSVFGIRGATATPTIAQMALTGGKYRVVYRDDSATLQDIDCGALANGTLAVLTARKTGNTKQGRVNAGTWGTNSTALGATTVTTTQIGAGAVASAYWIGNIYPVIAIKGTVTDADLLTLEKFVGALSGVTI